MRLKICAVAALALSAGFFLSPNPVHAMAQPAPAVMTGILFEHAMADTVVPAPSPTPTADPKIVGGIKDAAGGVDSVTDFIGGHAGTIATVLTLLLGVIAKVFSSANSGPIVSFIQSIFDGAAWLFASLGKLCKAIGDLLASVIASDGLLGKK